MRFKTILMIWLTVAILATYLITSGLVIHWVETNVFPTPEGQIQNLPMVFFLLTWVIVTGPLYLYAVAKFKPLTDWVES